MGDGDPPRILLSDRQDLPVDAERLIEAARATLTGEGAGRSELSLSFVSAEEMGELHERYLGEPGPTDVLSFPLGDEDESGVRLVGDVIVCPAVANEGANAYPDELRLLVVHGILHLLGHDHEEPGERRAMWELQERYSGVPVR